MAQLVYFFLLNSNKLNYYVQLVRAFRQFLQKTWVYVHFNGLVLVFLKANLEKDSNELFNYFRRIPFGQKADLHESVLLKRPPINFRHW